MHQWYRQFKVLVEFAEFLTLLEPKNPMKSIWDLHVFRRKDTIALGLQDFAATGQAISFLFTMEQWKIFSSTIARQLVRVLDYLPIAFLASVVQIIQSFLRVC